MKNMSSGKHGPKNNKNDGKYIKTYAGKFQVETEDYGKASFD